MQIGYRIGGRHIVVGVHRDAPGRFNVSVDGEERAVEAALLDGSTMQLHVGGTAQIAYLARVGGAVHVWIGGEVYQLTPESAASSSDHVVHLLPQILSPMPGKVLQVLVEAGQTVAAGDGLVIVEAMKMEHRIAAEAEAVVRAVHVVAGQMVDGGAVLVELDYPTA